MFLDEQLSYVRKLDVILVATIDDLKRGNLSPIIKVKLMQLLRLLQKYMLKF